VGSAHPIRGRRRTFPESADEYDDEEASERREAASSSRADHLSHFKGITDGVDRRSVSSTPGRGAMQLILMPSLRRSRAETRVKPFDGGHRRRSGRHGRRFTVGTTKLCRTLRACGTFRLARLRCIVNGHGGERLVMPTPPRSRGVRRPHGVLKFLHACSPGTLAHVLQIEYYQCRLLYIGCVARRTRRA
jgi:hypothetical protein